METETGTKIIERHLACVLTEEERASLGRLAAHEVKAYGEIEEQKKQALADFGARLKAARKTIDELSEKVDTGVEWRMVECHRITDRYLGRVRVVRTDTGQVIEDRSLTHGESQMDFGME